MMGQTSVDDQQRILTIATRKFHKKGWADKVKSADGLNYVKNSRKQRRVRVYTGIH